MKKKIFLFMGPPGSGKGTLSSLCVKNFGWHQVSTGNLCRNHIEQNTEIGQQIKSAIEEGKLVSDEVIADMIKDWMLSETQLPEGIIFDGYPRTKRQAELLYKFLQDALPDVDLELIKLQLDADLVVDRILSRVSCSNKKCQQVYSLMKDSVARPKNLTKCDQCGFELIKRSDDTKDTLKNRIHVYYQHEQDIINFYINKGMQIDMINAAQGIQDVFKDFKKLAERKDYVC